MPPDVYPSLEALPLVADVAAQPNVTRLFDDLFLRGQSIDPSFRWPLEERSSTDDHFYGAWLGPRRRAAINPPSGYASRVANVHAPYLDHLIDGVPVSAQPTVYMTGGGTASGKSAGLLQNPDVGFPAEGKAARIDPDEAMSYMPEYQKALAAGDKNAANASHTEASFMSKMGLNYALQHRRDVVYDAVGDSGIEKLAAKVADMRQSGATRVIADYATVSIDTALARNEARALKTGRFVPTEFIRQSYRDVSNTWYEAARRGTFDRLRLWDTNNRPPVLIATAIGGRIAVQNQKAWEVFLSIGGMS